MSQLNVQKSSVKCLPYHRRKEICKTRPFYRRGKRETSVKVFTIADESKYLLIHRIPAIQGVNDELRKVCSKFGAIERFEIANNYPSEEFFQVVLIKFYLLKNALYAKKKLDDNNFYGSSLHVCYAPELESLEETAEKLSERKKFVHFRLKNTCGDKHNTNNPYRNNFLQPNSLIKKSKTSSSVSKPENSISCEQSQIISEKPVETAVNKGMKRKAETELPDRFEDIRLIVRRKMFQLETPKIRWRNQQL